MGGWRGGRLANFGWPEQLVGSALFVSNELLRGKRECPVFGCDGPRHFTCLLLDMRRRMATVHAFLSL